MEELARLQKAAVDPVAIGRMIALIENELGYPLYDAVGQLKKALSGEESAVFHFSGGGLTIDANRLAEIAQLWIMYACFRRSRKAARQA